MWTSEDFRLYRLVQEWDKVADTRSKQSVLGRLGHLLERSILRASQYKKIFYGVKIFLNLQALKIFPSLLLLYVSRISDLNIPETVYKRDLEWYKASATFSQMYWILDTLKAAWITFDGFNV